MPPEELENLVRKSNNKTLNSILGYDPERQTNPVITQSLLTEAENKIKDNIAAYRNF